MGRVCRVVDEKLRMREEVVDGGAAFAFVVGSVMRASLITAGSEVGGTSGDWLQEHWRGEVCRRGRENRSNTQTQRSYTLNTKSRPKSKHATAPPIPPLSPIRPHLARDCNHHASLRESTLTSTLPSSHLSFNSPSQVSTIDHPHHTTSRPTTSQPPIFFQHFYDFHVFLTTPIHQHAS